MIFNRHKYGGRHMHNTTTPQRLCACTGHRTREHNTPQQCRRCGCRIDRQFDDEIGEPEKVSIVIDLPEADWEYPYGEQD